MFIHTIRTNNISSSELPAKLWIFRSPIAQPPYVFDSIADFIYKIPTAFSSFSSLLLANCTHDRSNRVAGKRDFHIRIVRVVCLKEHGHRVSAEWAVRPRIETKGNALRFAGTYFEISK